MDASQVVLKLVLDAIGQPVELDTFTKRFSLQKKVYLTRLTGLDLGYRFGWYLRGPYSRELTNDVFHLLEHSNESDEESKVEELNTSAASQARRAPELWSNRPTEITEEDWLELLASLHYLKHIAYWPNDTERGFDEVYDALVESKPRFKDRVTDVRRAWDRMVQLGLVDHKVLQDA